MKINDTEMKQRVSKKDAKVILDSLIKNFKEPLQSAVSWDEDYAGGSQMHINENIVMQLIDKLCR